MSKPMRIFLWMAAVLAGLTALGCASSKISVHACEIKTARWLGETVPPGTPFFVRHDEADPRRLAIWDEAGARYRIHDPKKDGPEHFPWCSIGRTETHFPFLVSVEYGWVRESLVGDGGKLWYLCFFGLTCELGRSISWMT